MEALKCTKEKSVLGRECRTAHKDDTLEINDDSKNASYQIFYLKASMRKAK